LPNAGFRKLFSDSGNKPRGIPVWKSEGQTRPIYAR
jgi:hypothetical protein